MSKVIKPNFFIVGAPRCGTTSLYNYLSSHPNIFMSFPKEPGFFSSDFSRYQIVKTMPQYLSLFKKTKICHQAVGEASTRYLQSLVALKNIKQFNDKAKIIVMLRNPVDLVYSSYYQMRYRRNEDASTFKEAWNLQDLRKKGFNLPKRNHSEQFLQYSEVGKLGAQVKRLLGVFSHGQVKIIIFDDFISKTREIYEEVLDFLSIPRDDKITFKVFNQNRVYRRDFINRLTKDPPKKLSSGIVKFKKIAGLKTLGIKKILNNLNAKHIKRQPLDEEFKKVLIKEFQSDVLILSDMINRDLSHWLK
tara:strand:+ start:2519 stop:3430 length:912 start_codon:yes stop_codon:yes gene_type:complete